MRRPAAGGRTETARPEDPARPAAAPGPSSGARLLQLYPVIVGAGKRLFADTSSTKRLHLAEARTAGDIHILVYERAN